MPFGTLENFVEGLLPVRLGWSQLSDRRGHVCARDGDGCAGRDDSCVRNSDCRNQTVDAGGALIRLVDRRWPGD